MANTKNVNAPILHRRRELAGLVARLTPSHTSAVIYRYRRRQSAARSNFRHTSAPSRRAAPEVVPIRFAQEGVGNAGCPMHPQPRVQ